jgi:outer membrane receptor protein involved in Fe transport
MMMTSSKTAIIRQSIRCGSTFALAIALTYPALASAQSAALNGDVQPESGAVGPSDIVVTGSRIQRKGFDQPTPTTVMDGTDLQQGDRPNLQEALDDQPQFRPTVSPAVTVGNTSSGTAPVDLRGLGTERTLTLLNGRRFIGDNNLNFVPMSLVNRVEVVTGGASAAYGSGAVAGVVNIILDDDLKGLSLGGNSGISTRGDAQQYQFSGSYGTHFSDGKGHVMVGAEWSKDEGIPDRNSRPNLGSAGIVPVNPSDPDGPTMLVRDVNYNNQSRGGLITSGVLAGMTFNPNGTLRPFQAGTPAGPGQMVGGADGVGLYDDIYASTPSERLNVFARVSYDVGKAKFWIDGAYGRSTTNYPFVPDFLIPPLTISATNPFLSPSIRNELAAAGESSFTLGRDFDDILNLQFDAVRVNKEIAIGVDGELGNGWKYSAHYSHGQVDDDQQLKNARLAANFNNALDAVSSGGKIVCAINADSDPTNDDPSCAPLNPFGAYNASSAALNYITGTEHQHTVDTLDEAAAELQGDLIPLWAGPLTVVIGAEARWQNQTSSTGALDQEGVFGIPLFTSSLEGGFNVKEGYSEVALPLLNLEHKLKVDFNGAARYSDYSTSGGIWSWKLGGTARIFNDLLLRATRSRDIRSPDISDLYSVMELNVGPVADQDKAGRTGIPGYNPNPTQVTTYNGGNPDLRPEIGSTFTVGGSYSPSFIRGFSLSVDYYHIKIAGAITQLSASQLTAGCAAGNQAACDDIIRDPVTQTLQTVFSNEQNIASFETSGIDFEASYILPLSRLSHAMNGTLRFHGLASYVNHFIYDTGDDREDFAGDVGDAVAHGVPKWRGTLSMSYDDDIFGVDVRVRYVGGGLFDHTQTELVNNAIASRTYVDLGARFKVNDRFTLTAQVNNLFDVDPPLVTTGSPFYDIIGTYVSFGAKVHF